MEVGIEGRGLLDVEVTPLCAAALLLASRMSWSPIDHRLGLRKSHLLGRSYLVWDVICHAELFLLTDADTNIDLPALEKSTDITILHNI